MGAAGRVMLLLMEDPEQVTLTHTHIPLPASTSSSIKCAGRLRMEGKVGHTSQHVERQPSLRPGTLSGKASKLVRTGSRQPNLEDLKRRMMSWRVAATTKYSCFSRSSFPSKNWRQFKAGQSQGGGSGLIWLWMWPGETPPTPRPLSPELAPISRTQGSFPHQEVVIGIVPGEGHTKTRSIVGITRGTASPKAPL